MAEAPVSTYINEPTGDGLAKALSTVKITTPLNDGAGGTIDVFAQAVVVLNPDGTSVNFSAINQHLADHTGLLVQVLEELRCIRVGLSFALHADLSKLKEI